MRPGRIAGIRRALLAWAPTVDRPLPWRGETDPYRVLVSEVMLQQTQAPRVVPYYERFVARYPDPLTLAGAEPADVLRAWGTLGYPRRALHLWRAARQIAEHGFPSTVAGLMELPGVGPYTARAVAAFALRADEPVLEANVRRILHRLAGEVLGERDGWQLAARLLPAGRAAEWNQALMDLGATVCRPRVPDCRACPLSGLCATAAAGRAPSGPVRRPREPFRATRRFARGRVVAALRDAPGGVAADGLATAAGLEPGRAAEALGCLVADGIVHLSGERVYLGPEPDRQRARPRRASTSPTT